jgi:hypothetical protein
MTVNVELFALSYGSLVRAIVKDTNNVDDANAKLLKIGTAMGSRIADDLVVKHTGGPGVFRFKNLRAACDLLADYGFKTCLGITATCLEPTDTRVVIRLSDQNTPVTRFVTIPPEYEGLVYLMPLLGAIKSILLMFHYNVDVTMKSDRLKGDQFNDIEIKLIDVMKDTLPPGEYLNT